MLAIDKFSFIIWLFLGGSGVDAVICPKCQKIYKNKNSLSVHLSRDCGKGKKFVCGQCMKSFKRKDSLQLHYMTLHYKTHNNL